MHIKFKTHNTLESILHFYLNIIIAFKYHSSLVFLLRLK